MTVSARPLPTQELIYLDPEDDLATVRAKIEASTADELYLVIPRRVPILRTPLEFRVLARIAAELGSETIIVTSDPARRQLAAREGFRTRRTPGRLRTPVAGSLPSGGGLLEWLPLPPLGSLLLIVLLVATLLALNLFVLPVYRVTVTPQAETVRRELDVTVDPTVPALDLERAVLPGEEIEARFEVVGSTPTTGVRSVPSERARGEVLLTNNRDALVVLPKGTIVVADSGARFQTESEARLQPLNPVGVRVAITAVEPGAAGNVPANTIRQIEGRNVAGVTLTNQRPTTGGADREARVVAPEDLAKLREQLERQAREQALVELQTKVGADRSLPPQSLKLTVESESYDRPAGAEAERVSGRLNVLASAVAFSNQTLGVLAERLLARQGGTEARLSPGSLRTTPPQIMSVEGRQVRLRFQAEGTLLRTVDPGAIAAALRGKSVAEARAELARLSGLASPPRFEVWPSWADRAYRVEVAIAPPR